MGGNPITRPVLTMLSLVLVMLLGVPSAGRAKEKAPEKSGIKGKVVFKETGEPAGKTYIYAYVGKVETRAAQMGIIGISDWISHGSDDKGKYKLDLPPGSYFVAARKRVNGLNFGPLYKGDWYDHKLARKPVVVKKGKYTNCDFSLIRLEEPMFFQGLTAAERVSDTGIKGSLLDAEGNHVPGTFVTAYVNNDMKRIPDFASTLTDDEGRYTLYLPRGGRYWLAARFKAMKMPEEGEPFARFNGSPDHSVVVKDNEFLTGIDLVLKPYEGEGPAGSMQMQR